MDKWTFLHVRTESGDDYYFVASGWLKKNEIKEYFAAELDDEADFIYDWHVEYAPPRGESV